MPRAFGQKFHYRDHDTDVVNEAPPVQNQWYTVFDAHDVRLLWCVVYQKNDELAAKNVETRWTIDGTVYLNGRALDDDTEYYVFRTQAPSTGGTSGLFTSTSVETAVHTTDKRGLSFKVEVRMTSALGTNQVLRCYCVRETKVLT